jgi:hypothetical protein
VKRALVIAVFLAVGLLAAYGVTASAHSSGCHSAHSCPSDHHTYIWYDGNGQGWSCAEPGAPEYDPSRDTTTIVYAGYTYYCYAAGTATPTPTPTETTPTQTQTIATETTPTYTATYTDTFAAPAPAPDARCHVRGALPDRSCTPGARFHVTTAQVCKRGYSRRVRNVPESEKNAVYAEYGITHHTTGQYEVDHLISLELGGSNSIKNLFPEAASPRPGFHEKDTLENRLHALVCDGKMRLRTAQRQIATEWLKPYRRLFG